MNSYTVHFRYAREHVDATDSDMAVMQAAKIIAQDLSDEERGELIAVELWNTDRQEGEPESTFYYTAAGEADRFATSEIIERDTMWAPKTEAPLPPRRARGMSLSRWFCDIEQKWHFDVVRFGYSASLNCAYNEEELLGGRFGDSTSELSARDMEIVREWQHNEDRYIAQAEAETGLVEKAA